MNKAPPSSVPAAELALLRNAGRVASRYAAYPPRSAWRADYGGQPHEALARCDARAAAGLALYVHLPFCHAACAFCNRHKIVTRDGGKAARYLDFLERDLAAQAAQHPGRPRVLRMYWGGGTPTYYTPSQLGRLWSRVRERFECAEDGEYTLEIDPRTVDEAAIAQLRAMGFNAASFGVPELAPPVLEAVTRPQTAEQSLEAIAAARRAGFASVGVELMYGLPRQHAAAFEDTLTTLLAAQPDRIALHDYVHAPRRHKAQRQLSLQELPSPAEKLEMLARAVERVTPAGYLYLGPDCFVRPDDALAVARNEQRLHYDLLGYGAAGGTDVMALGVSAVGSTASAYTQNEADLGAYYDRVGSGLAPVARGIVFSPDDLVRRAVMRSLLCHARISYAAIEKDYSIAFERYFAAELKRLEPYAAAGLVRLESRQAVLEPRGRLWARNLCALFDRYREPSRGPRAGEGGRST